MTTPRQELEVRLAAFAAAYSPVLTVSYENQPFTRPNPTPGTMWLECYFVSGPTVGVTTDASRNRERGTWVVNCWLTSGVGMGKLDTLVAAVVKAFPVVPKQGQVSVEQPGSSSQAKLASDGWICVSISYPYRVESTA
jgi:hypothetical protein